MQNEAAANPCQSPTTTDLVPSPRSAAMPAEFGNLWRGLRAICWFYLFFAAIYTLMGIFALAGSLRLVPVDKNLPPLYLSLPIAAVAATILATTIGILRRMHWARRVFLPIAVISLLGIPIGTLFGGYFLWNYRRIGEMFDAAATRAADRQAKEIA